MIQGHPCLITELTTTKMMDPTSGRSRGPHDKHPSTWCDHCQERLTPGAVRYACLDCLDFDLCERCETTVPETHASGQHVFAKIRDSTAVDVQSYRH